MKKNPFTKADYHNVDNNNVREQGDGFKVKQYGNESTQNKRYGSGEKKYKYLNQNEMDNEQNRGKAMINNKQVHMFSKDKQKRDYYIVQDQLINSRLQINQHKGVSKKVNINLSNDQNLRYIKEKYKYYKQKDQDNKFKNVEYDYKHKKDGHLQNILDQQKKIANKSQTKVTPRTLKSQKFDMQSQLNQKIGKMSSPFQKFDQKQRERKKSNAQIQRMLNEVKISSKFEDFKSKYKESKQRYKPINHEQVLANQRQVPIKQNIHNYIDSLASFNQLQKQLLYLKQTIEKNTVQQSNELIARIKPQTSVKQQLQAIGLLMRQIRNKIIFGKTSYNVYQLDKNDKRSKSETKNAINYVKQHQQCKNKQQFEKAYPNDKINATIQIAKPALIIVPETRLPSPCTTPNQISTKKHRSKSLQENQANTVQNQIKNPKYQYRNMNAIKNTYPNIIPNFYIYPLHKDNKDIQSYPVVYHGNHQIIQPIVRNQQRLDTNTYIDPYTAQITLTKQFQQLYQQLYPLNIIGNTETIQQFSTIEKQRNLHQKMQQKQCQEKKKVSGQAIQSNTFRDRKTQKQNSQINYEIQRKSYNETVHRYKCGWKYWCQNLCADNSRQLHTQPNIITHQNIKKNNLSPNQQNRNQYIGQKFERNSNQNILQNRQIRQKIRVKTQNLNTKYDNQSREQKLYNKFNLYQKQLRNDEYTSPFLKERHDKINLQEHEQHKFKQINLKHKQSSKQKKQKILSSSINTLKNTVKKGSKQINVYSNIKQNLLQRRDHAAMKTVSQHNGKDQKLASKLKDEKLRYVVNFSDTNKNLQFGIGAHTIYLGKKK